MKQMLLLLAIPAVLTFSSCKKEDNNSSSVTSSIADIVTNGSWKVSYFHESGTDLTSNFNGYVFSFNGSGSMSAADSRGTTSGTWNVDDSNANEFRMSVGNADPLLELNRSWLVVSQSSSEIQLTDDSVSVQRTLHFSKI